MRIDKSSPEFDSLIIFVDDQWCRGAIAADEEEGWVEVIDISSMAPLESTKEISFDTPEPIVLMTKRIQAKKSVKILKRPNSK